MGLEVGLHPANELLQGCNMCCMPSDMYTVFRPHFLLARRWCDIGYIAVFVQVAMNHALLYDMSCIHSSHETVLIAVGVASAVGGSHAV